MGDSIPRASGKTGTEFNSNKAKPNFMKTHQTQQRVRAILALLIAAFAPSLFASPLTIPGADGSDDALNVTVSTNIDLSLAVTGAWDANNAANAGKGIYDASKWAVVFKYSSVNIAPGATVTFSNHPSRAPVVCPVVCPDAAVWRSIVRRVQ